MELPPRVKTLYPNANNIVNDEDTPIPIESAFFLEDAEKDPYKANRFYFNFPGNWVTSNNGEIIVGVRDIWMLKRKRTLEFSIRVFKVKSSTYNEISKKYNAKNVNDVYRFCINTQIGYKENYSWNCNEIKMVYNLLENDDLSNFHNAVMDCYKVGIKYLETNIFGKTTLYREDDIKVNQYYDNNGYNISFDTPFNHTKNPDYYYYFQLESYNDEFKEVFNIGTLSTENNKKLYMHHEKVPRCDFESPLTFKKLWDRCPFKVYSSIAEQSLHQYIGLSNVYYTPIKYYKLRSTDQKFWVEFNSANRYNLPIKLPDRESFCIEMQFLPFNKML